MYSDIEFTKHYVSTIYAHLVILFGNINDLAKKISHLSCLIALSVLLTLVTSVAIARADNFIFPQGVYSGEKVKLTKFPNGGVVNATALERIALTQPVEPYTVKITDGIWALVGYHWGYKAIIEGKKGLIIYDTGDDIEEAQEIIKLVKKISKWHNYNKHKK